MFTVNCIEKTKIKKKEAGKSIFSKSGLGNFWLDIGCGPSWQSGHFQHRGSNPAIDSFYRAFFYCKLMKRKNKEKEAGNVPFKKWVGK